ncbi:UNVERIFIED_CONTAM: hypothetical protein Slati_0076100 [Sesamum latifolium]|uniref:Uncharacterized protein n=1 Tax=Sesamum latifolium TaxID=2727402 RepID=A0AAW2Y822_9LAMI
MVADFNVTEIMKRYIRLRSARDIWNALAKAFYDGSDESQLFALNQRAFSTKQVGRPLSIYYGDLVEIFQEMDHRDKIVMKDPDDIITYKKSVERLRVHIFLNGLDAEFEQIQGEILRKDPPLDLEETYAYVRRDFVRRTTMNGDSNQSESTALIARRTKPQHTNSKLGFSTSGDATARSARICTNCGEVGHTKARCYELIGYPEWWDPSKAPRKRNSKPNHHATVAVTKPTNVSENSSNHASVAVVESSNTGHSDSKTIGYGTRRGKLYYLDLMPAISNQMITTQYQAHIQVLRTDNGGEFVNQDLQRYLNLHGIVHQMTCPYSPQQNGVAERKNRHLLEVVRASLFEANMPTSYWGEAVTVATYLINRMPSSSLQFRTPFDFYKIVSASTMPNLPQVFDCVAFVHLHRHLRNKLEPRALQCVFVGYGLHQKGYRCYHPPSRKLYVTRDVVFHEDKMYYSTPESPIQGEMINELQTLDLHTVDIINNDIEDANNPFTGDENSQNDEDGMETTPETTRLAASPPNNVSGDQLISQVDSISESQVNSQPTRIRELPNRVTRGIPRVNYEPLLNSKTKYPINNFVSYHRLSKENEALVNQLSTVSIPSSVQDAVRDPKWKEAMNEEMKSLHKNSTWKSLIYLKGRNLLDVGGSSPSNTKQMELLNDTKQGLLLRDILRRTELIIWRHLHRCQDQYGSYSSISSCKSQLVFTSI